MLKILFLEDDSHYRDVVGRLLLRSYSGIVTTVATETQAREELSKEGFDLVLLDLTIDGRKCWDTLRIAMGNPGRPAAIVFSCEDTQGNADYAVSHGAFAFLSKPFDYDVLKTLIDSALQAPKRA